MELSVRDLTRIFDVSEKTVLQWIKKKGLTFHKVEDQYRFNRYDILEWARSHDITINQAMLGDVAEDEQLSLVSAIEEGGFYYNVPGATKEEVFGSISRLVKLPASFSPDELKELLLAREALASTGVGKGMAIPHVRDPIVLPIERPLVCICFLERMIEFGAIDGEPVHTFFFLLSSTTRDHLKLLSKISYMLHDTILLAMLTGREDAEKILARMRVIEEGIK